MSDLPPPGYGDAGDPDGGPALGGYAGELPPEAAQRLERGPWGSGLSVNDFAACAQVGLRPLALVQGFCVMQWSWYGAGSPYMYGGGGWAPGRGIGGPFGAGGIGGPGRPTGTIGGGPWGGGGFGGGGQRAYNRSRWGTTLSSYSCPHSYTSWEHRYWGEKLEQQWKTQAWAAGFNTARHRMIAEARDAGADGVIGVVDTVSSLIDRRLKEFHIYGTAVMVDDDRPTSGGAAGSRAGETGEAAGAAGADRPIWTTYLAGQRLVKLLESGFAPTSVVASMASVRIWAVCVTEMLMHGSVQMAMGFGPSEIAQISDTQMQVRDLARDHVKSTLGPDMLQGASLDVSWHDIAEGDFEVEAVLRGTRVHRFREADPLPPPELTVRMA